MVEYLVDELSKQGYHLLIEGTLRTTEVPRKTAQLLITKGYQVSLALIATKPELSYLSTLIRYDRTLHIIGKGKKERILFLGDQTTFNLLETYINKYYIRPNDYLFTGQNPLKALSEQSVRLILKKLVKKNNLSITITPHMFRHSFATMLLDKDVDIRYIQQILGHSSISVTQIYTHVSQSKQKEILTLCNPISSIRSRPQK